MLVIKNDTESLFWCFLAYKISLLKENNNKVNLCVLALQSQAMHSILLFM